CDFLRPNGARCRARPRTGRRFCFSHDPESRQERAAARRAGGRAATRRAAVLAGASDVCLTGVCDVTALIGETLGQVRRGDVDVKIANAVFYGTSVALRALMPDEAARELAELRALVAGILEREKAGHEQRQCDPDAGGDQSGGQAAAGAVDGGAAGGDVGGGGGPVAGGP
ncbi:MAG TPA: hypothetical protein VFW33_19325, partial [Gemmataceae bacterium]|nr:hypothetical protein [Gemmataceae bacterium]